MRDGKVRMLPMVDGRRFRQVMCAFPRRPRRAMHARRSHRAGTHPGPFVGTRLWIWFDEGRLEGISLPIATTAVEPIHLVGEDGSTQGGRAWLFGEVVVVRMVRRRVRHRPGAGHGPLPSQLLFNLGFHRIDVETFPTTFGFELGEGKAILELSSHLENDD